MSVDAFTLPGWGVELLLHHDADIDGWVRRVAAFLRQWGVPDGPISFTITSGNDVVGMNCRRVDIPGE